jgi:hypothetical protein
VAWTLLDPVHEETESTVKKFTRLSFADLARTYGWTITYADGYADGEAYRARRQQPPAYLLWGFDEYAQGFQAGFYDEPARLPPNPESSAAL